MISLIASLLAVWLTCPTSVFATAPVALVAPIGVDVDKYQVPKQAIVGAENPIALGELVDLSLSPIEPKPANLVQYTVSWQVFDGGVPKRVRSSGDGIFFGAGVQSKKLLVIAAVSYLFVVKDGDKITDAQVRNVLLTTELQIGQPEPPPGPGPRPGPGPSPVPTPTLPEGRFGLAKTMYDLAVSKGPANKGKAATIMAASFDSMASAVAAGAYKTTEAILKATREANNTALAQAGIEIAEWDAFGEEMQKILYEMHKNKKLASPEDYSDAWKEIATGLRAVK